MTYLTYGLLLLVALLSFYGPLIGKFLRFHRRKAIRTEFFRAVLHEINNVPDDLEALRRIRCCYDDVKYRYASEGGIFTSLSDALGLFYNRHVQRGHQAFAASYKLKLEQKDLDRLQQLRLRLDEQEPFANVSVRFQHFLESAHRFYHGGHSEAGFRELAKLEQAIKETENDLRQRKEAGRISMGVSVAGIVLTIAFGLAPFVAHLSRQRNGTSAPLPAQVPAAEVAARH